MSESLRIFQIRAEEEVDDDFNATVFDQATLVFVLVTCLLSCTIVFTFAKEYLMKSASRYAKMIYNALFSEMTILGFISLICYVITYGSLLDDWSSDIFGSDDESYISDTIGKVQGYVMWTMVMIMLHSVLLVNISKQSERNFEEYNDLVQDQEKISRVLASIDDIPSHTWSSWLFEFICNPIATWDRSSKCREIETIAVFHSLRREHIIRRAGIPPFEAEEREKRLPKDFDYSVYLSICLSTMLANVVACNPFSWFCLWLYIVVLFSVLMVVNVHYIAFASCLLAFAYLDLYLMHNLSLHCKDVFEQLVNPSHLRPRSHRDIDHANDTHELDGHSIAQHSENLDAQFPRSEFSNHSSFIYRLKYSPYSLPGYTRMDLTSQHWISKLILGRHILNRHEMLLWADKLGPSLYQFILRLHILVLEVSLPISLGLMLPYIFDEYGVGIMILFLFMLVVPPIVLLLWYYATITVDINMIIFTGQMRDTVAQNEAARIQKLGKVLRLMLMLAKIQAAEANVDLQFGSRVYDMQSPEVVAEIAEIERVYDTYDVDHTDRVDLQQLKSIVESLGIRLDEEGLEELFVILDCDRSGDISKSELVAWVMSRERVDTNDFVSLATRIFSMIDNDGSGELTLEEFREALLKFNEPPYNANFTDSEILSLLRDFDEDGDGNISLEEFLKVIEAGVIAKSID